MHQGHNSGYVPEKDKFLCGTCFEMVGTRPSMRDTFDGCGYLAQTEIVVERRIDPRHDHRYVTVRSKEGEKDVGLKLKSSGTLCCVLLLGSCCCTFCKHNFYFLFSRHPCMLCAPSNRRRPFSLHTKMADLSCFLPFLVKRIDIHQKSVLNMASSDSQVDKP